MMNYDRFEFDQDCNEINIMMSYLLKLKIQQSKCNLINKSGLFLPITLKKKKKWMFTLYIHTTSTIGTDLTEYFLVSRN